MSVDITDQGYTVVVNDDGVSLTVVTPGPTVPVGGAAGDLLVKNSSTNYDTAWTDSPTVDMLTFDVAAGDEPDAVGELAWDADAGTIDLRMTGNVLQHVGQDVYYRVQADEVIAKGDLVMAVGTVGNSGIILVAKARTSYGMMTDIPSQRLMGLAASSIASGAQGYVVHFGKLRQINTSQFSEGDILYADPVTPGGLTATQPAAPNWKTIVGLVVTDSSTVGEIFVRPTFGSSLNNDELVTLTNVTSGQVLTFNGSVWVNGTPTPSTASYVTLSSDGTLTNERVLTAGTGVTITDAGAGSTVTVATSAILPTVVDAKGDLIAGTAADTVARVPASTTNGQVLTVDTSQPTGMGWVTPTTDAPISASYVTLGTDGTLTNERVLTAGTGISVSDAGAGSTVTVATSAILPTVVDAKGDLIAGTGADTVGRLANSTTNGQMLTVDTSTLTGLTWSTPASIGAQYVTLASDSSLSAERVLTAGTGISITDAGANSTVTVATSAILPTVVDAKGDLLVGTTNDTVGRLAVGANDTVLMADSGETSGLAWRSPRLAGGAARPLLTGGAYLDGTTGLVLRGLSGNYASSPDSAALSITGDIDIKVKVTMADWTPSAVQTLVAKAGSATTRSYYLQVNTNGTLVLTTSTDGSAVVTGTSTVATGITDGTSKWVRATLDVVDSTNRVYKFYTSDNGTAWTQLGTTVTTAGTTSIFDSTSVLEVGSITIGTANLLNGTIGRVLIQSAFDTADNTTSLQFDANFETQTADALAFTESSTNAATVTINTTRYTYGIPNASLTAGSTTDITASRDFYQPFQVTAPITIDMVAFEVTAAPASTSTAYFAIYAADSNFQPTGAPVLNDSISVPTVTLAVYRKQFNAITLQPGTYLLAYNVSVVFGIRFWRGGITPTLHAMGANGLVNQLFTVRTSASFPSSPAAIANIFAGSSGFIHPFFLRWRAA